MKRSGTERERERERERDEEGEERRENGGRISWVNGEEAKGGRLPWDHF